jgi:hypothetical protein
MLWRTLGSVRGRPRVAARPEAEETPRAAAKGRVMKKSKAIATCLVNSGMIYRLEDAENEVRQIFLREFPQSNFVLWDQDIDDRTAEQIIKDVGRASRINVRKFIEDFW